MKLYLDDIRPCPEGWTYAQTVSEAVSQVEACLARGETWTHASLDHDLAEEHYRISRDGSPPHTGTGLDFVDWMIERNMWPEHPPRVHSMNPDGAKRMKQAIVRYGPYHMLGWDDPHPIPDSRCDEPGCTQRVTCGWPSPSGYRRTCGHHYRDLRARNA